MGSPPGTQERPEQRPRRRPGGTVRRGRGRAGLTPVVADARTMAVATCVFYGIGAVVALLLTLWPHTGADHVWVIRALAALLLLVGPALLLWGDACPPWVHHALNLFGSTALSVAVWLAGGGEPSIALCTLYVLVPAHAFTLFRRPLATAYTTYAAVLAALLCWPGHRLGSSLLFAGIAVNVVAGGTVGWLVRSAERAERDGVTGLLNRRGFDRALEQALADARRDGGTLTVASLDLDHFTRINETEGRAAGDDVLHETGRIWRSLLPDHGRLAHWGGGEFAVLLPDVGVEAASRLVEGMRTHLPHLGTASAGLAEWHPDDTMSVLISRADASLYRAKSAGRNRIDPRVGMNVTVREMREALDRAGSFPVLFQPIVDLAANVTVGAEALVRWDHPVRGRLYPADFIPLAEESDVIVPLGRHVLAEACRTVVRAERRGRRVGKITVNVSGVQLQQPGFAAEVLEILEGTGLDPVCLVLEVTESSLAAEAVASIAALEELRLAGVSIAIDDFGTGYSSLSRLAHLPVDILKIDKAFVSSIVPGRPAPIIASITALAEALGLATVAEGIENFGQAQVLAEHGCHRGQGWLYGRPMALEQIDLPGPIDRVPLPRGTA